jgi:small nuclear ribonucleoprotein (snRNP)-like protein
MLIELKNGDTYNGRLVSCNVFMNICLKDVICTSKASIFFIKFRIVVISLFKLGWRSILEDARMLYSRKQYKILKNTGRSH